VIIIEKDIVIKETIRALKDTGKIVVCATVVAAAVAFIIVRI